MWLCVRFALLPLESFWLNNSEQSEASPFDHQAVAVSEKQRIICCNQVAYQKGIREGQTVSTGYALLDELFVIERNLLQEQQRLNQFAMQAYSFSPVLSVWDPDCLVLEVGRSLSLFGGLANLLQHIEGNFQQQDISYCLGIGPTPKAAEVFSYSPLPYSYELWDSYDGSLNQELFRERIYQLPIHQLTIESKALEKISTIGLKKVSELFLLPESSLEKRLGRDVVHYLQQLMGKRPDVQTNFKPKIFFDQCLEFIDVIHHQKALLFPMKRLLDELIRFLRLYQKSGQSLKWTLKDIYQKETYFNVYLAQDELNLSRYTELTRLSLESIKLTGPIESIRLTVDDLIDSQVVETSLFAQTEAFKTDRHFAHKIIARLGKENCYWLKGRDEVIPELAQNKVEEASSVTYQVNRKRTVKNKFKPFDYTLRPNWLLSVPQPIGCDEDKLYWRGHLTLVSQPERIVHYWWKKPVVRDYFIAQHERGNHYWVFFDGLKQYWFLHGIFS
ncbi:Y-family DNA polymerase [Pleionea sediminis]|uniref:Y-family DNA polymerase n=1 Tax=Pleionea sediminis TaxID=2569479 RepID=UPI001184998B|nr:DNA polymerase Y family protein [Pleionea sediminis]